MINSSRYQLALLTFFMAINSVFGQISFVRAYDSFSGFSIQQTNDNGFILTGDGAALASYYGVTLAKTDQYGSIQWLKTFEGSISQWGEYAIQTSDGGYILTGRTYTNTGADCDIYVVKTNSTGDTIWTRSYGTIGTGDGAMCVLESVDGNYVVTGFSDGSLGFSVILIKIDPNGNLIWNYEYGSSALYLIDARSFAQTKDKGFIIAGRVILNSNTYDFLLKVDSAGSLEWAKYYDPGLAYSWGSTASCVKQTIDGGYVMSGKYGLSSDYSYGISLFEIIKTDSLGNMLWDKAYGDTTANTVDVAYTVDPTFDGGLIAGGITFSFGGGQMYLVKTDYNGNLQWSRTFGNSYSSGQGFAIQAKDSSYVISGTLGIFGSYPFNIIKTDVNGNADCNMQVPPTNVYTLNCQATLLPLNVISSQLSRSHLTQVINLSSNDTVVCGDLGTSPNIKKENIEIYPNPANSKFTIKLSSEMKNARIQILNSFASTVISEVFSGSTFTFDQKLTDGIYFIIITDGKKTLSEKLAVQQ